MDNFTTFPLLSVSQIKIPHGVTLSDDDKANLLVFVAIYRHSAHRMVNEFINMSSQLHEMERLLGREFIPFVRAHLNISQATAFRYLRIHAGMTLVNDGGKPDTRDFERFTQGALYLIGGQTDDDLVMEIQLLAERGEKINEKVVRQVITRRDRRRDAELALARAESANAVQALKACRTTSDEENTRLRLELHNMSNFAARCEAEAADANEEIERLVASKTRVMEKRVEVVPAGFQSVQTAIAIKTRELRVKEAELSAKTRQLAWLKVDEIALQTRISTVKTGTDLADAFVLAVNALIAQFPVAVLAAAMQNMPDFKARIAQLVAVLAAYAAELAEL